jgi:hypothetical protein
MPRNITITFEDGSTHVYQNAPDDVTPEAVTQRATQEFGKPVASLDGGNRNGGLKEVGRVADKTVRGGVMALPGLIGDAALSAVKNLHQGVEALPTGGMPAGTGLPGMTVMQLIAEAGKAKPIQNTQFGDVVKTLETAGGLLPPKSQPETEMGKAAGNIGETTLATVLGGGAGSMGQKATIGLASGGGGELAARLFGDNGVTRFLGSLLGGGSAGVATAVKSNADDITREAVKHVSPSDWRRAKVVEATLEREGIDHLKSQLLGPRSTLDDVVAAAGTHPNVKPKLTSKVQNSAEQSRKAYERFASTNMPIVTDERAQVLHDVQGSATSAVRNLKKQSNDAFAAAMPPKNAQYPEEYVKAIHKALVDLAESPKYGIGDARRSILKLADELIEGTSTDTSKINPAKLAWAKAEGVDLATIEGASTRQKFVTSQHKINNLIKELNLKATKDDYKGLPVEDVKGMLKTLTPEFDPARAAKETVMKNTVNPAQRGLTGQIMQMGGGVRPDKATAKDTALTMVFPKDRPQPQAIIQMGKEMGGDQVGLLLREHLARNMETSTAIKSSFGEQVQGPFRFVEHVAGTNAQRQNLEAALKVTAEANKVNPGAVKMGFYKLMRAFESTKDLKLPENIDRAALQQQSGATIPGFLIAPNSRLGRFFWEKTTAKTFDKIAELVLSKDGLKQLEAIGRSPKADTARQTAISILTASQQAPQVEGESN